jgi:uncharacterized protein with NRDE domain
MDEAAWKALKAYAEENARQASEDLHNCQQALRDAERLVKEFFPAGEADMNDTQKRVISTEEVYDGELFDVVQFFVDDQYEYVRRRVPVKAAIHAAYHYTHNVAAMAGLTSRVVIVDENNFTIFEWIIGKGVVFPIPLNEPPKDYRKH